MKKDGIIIIGLSVLVALMLFSVIAYTQYQEKYQLGQAICNQEYDLTYRHFANGILSCREPPQKTILIGQYDNIQIQIQQSRGEK